MKPTTLLFVSNLSMGLSFILFALLVVVAYGFEHILEIYLATLLHVSQIVLAGVFKVAYVVRLVCQKQLGYVVS